MWIRETVSKGFSIEFLTTPGTQFLVVPRYKAPKKHMAMKAAIQHLLEIEAIEVVPHSERESGVY